MKIREDVTNTLIQKAEGIEIECISVELVGCSRLMRSLNIEIKNTNLSTISK